MKACFCPLTRSGYNVHAAAQSYCRPPFSVRHRRNLKLTKSQPLTSLNPTAITLTRTRIQPTTTTTRLSVSRCQGATELTSVSLEADTGCRAFMSSECWASNAQVSTHVSEGFVVCLCVCLSVVVCLLACSLARSLACVLCGKLLENVGCL